MVSELQDVDNVPLTQLVGGDIVECVVAHDFIGRLIVQSGRQPGLAQVLESLLGFGGSEFYMQQWPELVGCRFGDVLFQFAHAIPIGVIKEDGTTLLSPENEYEVEDTDELIVLAEDDDSYGVVCVSSACARAGCVRACHACVRVWCPFPGTQEGIH